MMKGLTEYERVGLEHVLNLADGHAYQGIESLLPDAFGDMVDIWTACERVAVPEMEERFRHAFARLADSPAMARQSFFKICPTASNSIDVVAAVAAHLGLTVRLVEPAFDNLALILRRRRVPLLALDEQDLLTAVDTGTVAELLADDTADALFLVQPNNPTGQTLDAESFRAVAEACASAGKLLLLDKTFRFYGRAPFDDHEILLETGVSFIAFEDTGKVWPTHDLKASLLFASRGLQPLVEEIYNEIFLCHSRFALAILERCVLETTRRGLASTLWRQVDQRRALLRDVLDATDLRVDAGSLGSELPVEWLSLARTGMNDLEMTATMADSGLYVLPGRHFYWGSSHREDRHGHIRVALMKPLETFSRAMGVLRGLSSFRRPAPILLAS
jgi:aspartate/methionine/tyrosine aminotransferase